MSPKSELTLNLAAEINAAFAESSAIAAAAKLNAREAITRALECGRLLNLQKDALSHGQWQDWLAEHCPTISYPTARRYMRLSQNAPTNGLEDAAGLRQAYMATGVLPETLRHRPEPDANTPTVSYVRGLDQFRRWFNQRIEVEPVAKWSPAARRLLRNDLAWFKKLHDDLAA